MNSSKIHIYFVPGMAANSKIFDFLQFSNSTFELHFLDWLMPLSINESLENYASRMNTLILEKNPIIIGVSFGGIVAQEMSKLKKFKSVIIISSVKNVDEIPLKFKIFNKLKLYGLISNNAVKFLENLYKISGSNKMKHRADLYDKYLAVRNKNYLIWAVKSIFNWDQKTPPKNIIHIHGSKDPIFPIEKIKNCISIKNGNHAMILYKAKTISKLISELILSSKSK